MTRRRAAFIGAMMWSLFALWVVPACAQFTANIQGVIQDPSGATVAKAKIVLVNTGTGVKQSSTSDPSGNYRFVSLAPGNYKVSVEPPGFRSLKQPSHC
jgi:Carboxypeptidase regulatory-like domain